MMYTNRGLREYAPRQTGVQLLQEAVTVTATLLTARLGTGPENNKKRATTIMLVDPRKVRPVSGQATRSCSIGARNNTATALDPPAVAGNGHHLATGVNKEPCHTP